jgi:hypothetical protein
MSEQDFQRSTISDEDCERIAYAVAALFGGVIRNAVLITLVWGVIDYLLDGKWWPDSRFSGTLAFVSAALLAEIARKYASKYGKHHPWYVRLWNAIRRFFGE